MRLKIEGVLILCIVVVLAKTCFEKFAPKEHIKVNNFILVKTLVRHILQTVLDILTKKISVNMYLYLAKVLISIF